MATLILEVYFKTKRIIRDKEKHFIKTKESIRQEDKPILTAYASSKKDPKHKKQKLGKLK